MFPHYVTWYLSLDKYPTCLSQEVNRVVCACIHDIYYHFFIYQLPAIQ